MRTRRTINAIIIIVFLALSSCPSQQKDTLHGLASPEEVLEQIRKAVLEKDVDAFMHLGFWGNVPARMKEGMYQQFPNCFDYDNPTFKLRPMTKKEREAVEGHGVTYAWNLQPVGYVVIQGADKEDGSLSIPFGVRDGRYYVASRSPESEPSGKE